MSRLDHENSDQSFISARKAGLGAIIGILAGGVAASSLAVCSGLGYEAYTHVSKDAPEGLPYVPVVPRRVARRDSHSSPVQKSLPQKEGGTAQMASTTPVEPLLPFSPPEQLPTLTADLSAKIRARLEQIDAEDGMDEPERRKFLDGSIDRRDQYIGKPALKIAPYAKVSDLATASEYLAFLTDTMVSPDDVAELTNPRFIAFNETMYPSVPQDTICRATGDCDDYSVLVKAGLEHLGQRKGVDYHPRVIAGFLKGETTGHAVTVFEADGVQYSIDQNLPHPYNSIDQASVFFPSANRGDWMEITTTAPERSYRRTLEGRTLEVNYNGEISGHFGKETYTHDFDLSTLPADWGRYAKGNLCFNAGNGDSCEERVFFRKGKLIQVQYEKGAIDFETYDSTGSLSGESYRSGPYKFIEYKNGKRVDGLTFSGQTVVF